MDHFFNQNNRDPTNSVFKSNFGGTLDEDQLDQRSDQMKSQEIGAKVPKKTLKWASTLDKRRDLSRKKVQEQYWKYVTIEENACPRSLKLIVRFYRYAGVLHV